jgi:hypothetical protein
LKPRLLNLAAAVSLLLAIAIIVLWVRSYERRDSLVRSWHTYSEYRSWAVQSLYSSLNFRIARVPDTGRPVTPSYEYEELGPRHFTDPDPYWFPFPPVRFERSDPTYSYYTRDVFIAYWLLLLPTLPLPVIAIVRHRRRRQRETSNLCPTCGYDLRATPDRCPECGAVPEGKLQISSSKL